MKAERLAGYLLLPLLAAVILSTSVFGGCSDNDGVPSSLLGRWELQFFDLDNGTDVMVDDPSKYSVEFRSDERVALRVDCNTCGGSFSADDTAINFGVLACTRAFCGEDSLDRQFELVFVGTKTYEIDGDQLLIDYEEGTLVFTRANST